MKRTLLLAVLILFGLQTFAQNNDFDQRLLSLYSQDQITEMQNKESDVLNYWTYYLDNGYVVMDFDEKRHGKIQDEITISDDLNLLALKIFPTNSTKHFVDRESNKVLMILPKKKFVGKYNHFKAEQLK